MGWLAHLASLRGSTAVPAPGLQVAPRAADLILKVFYKTEVVVLVTLGEEKLRSREGDREGIHTVFGIAVCWVSVPPEVFRRRPWRANSRVCFAL